MSITVEYSTLVVYYITLFVTNYNTCGEYRMLNANIWFDDT